MIKAFLIALFICLVLYILGLIGMVLCIVAAINIIKDEDGQEK